MKKLIFALLFMLIGSQTFALSCAPLGPLPSLKTAQEKYDTIGTLKILSFEKEDFISNDDSEDFSDRTAEGNPRKFTTYKVKWDTLKKGNNPSEQFLLKINATSWMGYPTKFAPDDQITLTTNAKIKNGVMELDQDFGCGRNEWGRYSIDEVEKLSVKQSGSKPSESTAWQRFMDWFNHLFE